jgi:hypothetical protein
MNTFVSVFLLSCAGWIDSVHGKSVHDCMKDEKLNVRITDIVEFKEFDYRECKHSFYDGCKKQIYSGCELKLTNDRNYISELSCDEYKGK